MARWRIEKNFHKDKARKTIYLGTATLLKFSLALRNSSCPVLLLPKRGLIRMSFLPLSLSFCVSCVLYLFTAPFPLSP